MHLFKHLNVILKHRHKVISHCFRVGIGFQGLGHDLSKFSWEEFGPGIKYFQGTRSPNEAERENNGYSRAWMHHKGRNKHHFEYWTDYNPVTKKMEPVPMPLNYIAEMFCDRVAASKIYMGENYNDRAALAYFEKGLNTRIIHKDTSDTLGRWLKLLADEGEEVAFKTIRNELIEDKIRRI